MRGPRGPTSGVEASSAAFCSVVATLRPQVSTAMFACAMTFDERARVVAESSLPCGGGRRRRSRVHRARPKRRSARAEGNTVLAPASSVSEVEYPPLPQAKFSPKMEKLIAQEVPIVAAPARRSKQVRVGSHAGAAVCALVNRTVLEDRTYQAALCAPVSIGKTSDKRRMENVSMRVLRESRERAVQTRLVPVKAILDIAKVFEENRQKRAKVFARLARYMRTVVGRRGPATRKQAGTKPALFAARAASNRGRVARAGYEGSLRASAFAVKFPGITLRVPSAFRLSVL